MKYTSANLIIHPNTQPGAELINSISPDQAGWNFIHFASRQLAPEQTWSFDTQDHEGALVIFGGTVNVAANHGNWQGLGERADVISGLPDALYLPMHTTFKVQAITRC